MTRREILMPIDLGSSVAEFDKNLQAYFVETHVFSQIVNRKVDIISGDKGTGKTALFRILQERYRAIPSLEDVELIAAFNPTGAPIFRNLATDKPQAEGYYQLIWKAYIVSLVGNAFLSFFETVWTENMKILDSMLSRTGLRTVDYAPDTVFSSLLRTLQRVLKPSSFAAKFALQPNGFPVVTPEIKFDSKADEIEVVDFRAAFRVLAAVLKDVGMDAWILFDRLDEAFAGFSDHEIPALRALLRTYLDLQEFPSVGMKLFLRNDLFRKVTVGGFVNLTHINARRMEIVWEEEDLRKLLLSRLEQNPGLRQIAGPNKNLFDWLFPPQVDQGERKAATWDWLLSRIRDGNGIRPPRNLIDLCRKILDFEIKRQERLLENWDEQTALVTPESIKRGLDQLSEARVNDTLLAEAGPQAGVIEKFRDGKSEYSIELLRKLLGLSEDESQSTIIFLTEIGFLERFGDNYKVPILYRNGLGITQGKAF